MLKEILMNKEKLGIPSNHSLIQTDTKCEQRKGHDTDICWYDETDEIGIIVAKYIVKDSTGIYPPQKRSITYDRLSIDGQIINSGSLNTKDSC
jgi:hypothetical protein